MKTIRQGYVSLFLLPIPERSVLVFLGRGMKHKKMIDDLIYRCTGGEFSLSYK